MLDQLITAQGVNIDSDDALQTNACNLVVNGNVELFSILAKAKTSLGDFVVDLNKPNLDGSTPAELAIRYNEDEFIKIMAGLKNVDGRHVVDFNQLDNWGTSIIANVLRAGNLDILQILLENKIITANQTLMYIGEEISITELAKLFYDTKMFKLLATYGVIEKDQDRFIDPSRFELLASKQDLQFFSKQGRWDEVVKLIHEIKPNKKLVESVLFQASTDGQVAVMQQCIDTQGDNCAGQDAINKSFFFAVKAGKLDSVQYLLSIQSDIRPDQHTISTALKLAAKENKWDVVETLIALDGENKPDRKSVSTTLLFAAKNNKSELVKSIVSMMSDNKPEQESVSRAFLISLNKAQWDSLKAILVMDDDNKPNQAAVSFILRALIANKQWGLAKEVLAMRGGNKPNKESVSTALEFAAQSQQWELVKAIITMDTDNKPKQTSVEEAFFRACMNYNDLDTQQLILTMDGENKPSQKEINQTLLMTINNDRDNLLQVMFTKEQYESIKLMIKYPDQLLQKIDQQNITAAFLICSKALKNFIIEQASISTPSLAAALSNETLQTETTLIPSIDNLSVSREKQKMFKFDLQQGKEGEPQNGLDDKPPLI